MMMAKRRLNTFSVRRLFENIQQYRLLVAVARGIASDEMYY
jgi:hypothetical protein